MPKTPISKTAPDWWPAQDRPLCRLAALAPGTARGFRISGDTAQHFLDIIVWHQDTEATRLRGFVNKCPHLGLPLETFPDRFLNALGDTLICSAHGAQFDADGLCFAGPCHGAHLIEVKLAIEPHQGTDFIIMKKP